MNGQVYISKWALANFTFDFIAIHGCSWSNNDCCNSRYLMSSKRAKRRLQQRAKRVAPAHGYSGVWLLFYPHSLNREKVSEGNTRIAIVWPINFTGWLIHDSEHKDGRLYYSCAEGWLVYSISSIVSIHYILAVYTIYGISQKNNQGKVVPRNTVNKNKFLKDEKFKENLDIFSPVN